ncbi:DNA-binding response regulator, LytR/AlgR family [Catalinimonas alkaloidigena]|uniref:DNA-binding response regulator, LytR/AlgR family n=1 Tax=Catalinimonas alkaloidigena TaxID=1075417 RepID=A0A1G9MY92_9BACT|nr:LytTR family DNA-binding domain-containing protein [Catalinimonas alkaloidigena]SDL79198.1 DNA-binding response regulator, LytR/AlgR family [Catalinimonas alkaloidigena]
MDASFSCLIIDDDESVRFILEHYIERNKQLDLQASLSNGQEGLQYLLSHPVDILFLDVEMPGMNGIDLLRQLPQMPETILITSHENFAVDAFALEVADYLVKPVEYARFEKAVQRVVKNLSGPAVHAKSGPEELFVKVNGKMVRLDLTQVQYIEALSDYVIIVTDAHKHIVYSTMKAIDERLSGDYFMRIHRSYIINLKHIDTIEDNSVVINGKYIPISKSYQDDFFGRINKL